MATLQPRIDCHKVGDKLAVSEKEDTGYPHDGRANKDSYPHDGRADKDSYPQDRDNQYIMLSI